MKMAMRPRYYCDHCNRGTGSAAFMLRHEASCTANPNRECRMCGTGTPAHLENLAAILRRPGATLEDWQAKMVNLREAAEHCPCCILAAIRQSGIQRGTGTPDEEGYPDISAMCWREPGAAGCDKMLGFDFKEEKAAYLAHRADSLHADRYY